MNTPQLPGMPPEPEPRTVEPCTIGNYKAKVQERYHSWTLQDAMRNWHDFEEHRETFAAWAKHYARDPWLEINGKPHNPEGTIGSMIWVMQQAIEPDRSRLHPCLDFDEDLQKCFIRRGLYIYMELLINEVRR